MHVPHHKPFTIRQSIYNQIPLVLLILGSIWLLIWTSVNFDWAVHTFEFGPISFPLPLGGIITLVLVAILIHKLYDNKLIITDEYLLFIHGCLNWKEKSIRLEYSFIREIEIDQTIPQKFLGVGDIIVTLVATSLDSNKKLPGVRNPRKVKDLLYAYLHGARPAPEAATA